MKNFTCKMLSAVEAKQKYEALNLETFRYRKDSDFVESDKVLVFTESVVVENLFLDTDDFTFNHLLENAETDYILTIIIEGNLTVKENISCYETDGSIGLVVLGNVTAKNIAVGGHQLFVQGNLEVQEIFCGSYNHGTMFVKGNASAKYIIPDDYRIFVSGTVQGIIVGEDIYYYNITKDDGDYYGDPIVPTKTLDEILKEEFIDEEFGSILFYAIVDAIREKADVYTSNEPLYTIENLTPMEHFSWDLTYLATKNIKEVIWAYPPHIFIPDTDNKANVELRKNDGLRFYYNISRAPVDENLQPLHHKASLYLSDKLKNEKYFINADFSNDSNVLGFYNQIGDKFVEIDYADVERLKGLQDAFMACLLIVSAQMQIQRIFDYELIENLRQQLLFNVKKENGFQNGINYIGASNEKDGNHLLWVTPTDMDTIYFELKNNFVSIYHQEHGSETRYITSVYEMEKMKRAKKYLERATKAIDGFVIERADKIERLEKALQAWKPCFHDDNQLEFFENTLKKAIYDPRLFCKENKKRIKEFDKKYNEDTYFTDEVILGIALTKCLEETNFGIQITNKKSFDEATNLLKPFIKEAIAVDFNEDCIRAMELEYTRKIEEDKRWKEENLPKEIQTIYDSLPQIKKSRKIKENHFYGLNKKLIQQNNPFIILYFEFQAVKSPKYVFKAPVKDAEKIVDLCKGIYNCYIQGFKSEL